MIPAAGGMLEDDGLNFAGCRCTAPIVPGEHTGIQEGRAGEGGG